RIVREVNYELLDSGARISGGHHLLDAVVLFPGPHNMPVRNDVSFAHIETRSDEVIFNGRAVAVGCNANLWPHRSGIRIFGRLRLVRAAVKGRIGLSQDLPVPLIYEIISSDDQANGISVRDA